MVVKSRVLVLFLIFSLVSSILIGCKEASSKSSVENNQPITIGISQIAEHPALDAARKGFIDGLKSKGYTNGKNLEINYQNAQGDIPTAETIAKNFVSNKQDMILAIATPSAQAAFNATKEIPILITAVTDPLKAGLVESWEKSNTNVTGTSDSAPIKKQFKLIKNLIPKAKRIGILYNTSEANSEVQVNRAKSLAPEFNFEIITSGVTNINEISQTLESLTENIDVLYTPTDNLIASSMPLISTTCNKKNIPIIGAEGAHVKSGALATEGIDYYKLGFQTGLMAVDVIEGKNPKDMNISTLEDTELVINLNSSKKLNITIPENLKKNAKLIKDGE